MQLHTVNVIEYFSDTIQMVHAFSDDAEGNKEAEAVFAEIGKENGFSEEDIEIGLEDGLIRKGYELYIVHSCTKE